MAVLCIRYMLNTKRLQLYQKVKKDKNSKNMHIDFDSSESNEASQVLLCLKDYVHVVCKYCKIDTRKQPRPSNLY